jgi:antibiotic biosynthesis monooxygenase
MIALTHFADGSADFADRARAALAALAARPGYLRGTLGRSTDDPDAWLLLTEWENVGSYRRALGNYEVKLHATPLLATALDVPGGFEALVDVAPGGAEVVHGSDRESSG